VTCAFPTERISGKSIATGRVRPFVCYNRYFTKGISSVKYSKHNKQQNKQAEKGKERKNGNYTLT